jgi:hypothetical protein
LLLFGVGVLFKDGDFGIVLGATWSAHAPGKSARLGLGRPLPSGTAPRGALPLVGLLALVDIVDALTVTRIAVGGGGGGDARIVAEVHVDAHVA